MTIIAELVAAPISMTDSGWADIETAYPSTVRTTCNTTRHATRSARKERSTFEEASKSWLLTQIRFARFQTASWCQGRMPNVSSCFQSVSQPDHGRRQKRSQEPNLATANTNKHESPSLSVKKEEEVKAIRTLQLANSSNLFARESSRETAEKLLKDTLIAWVGDTSDWRDGELAYARRQGQLRN